MRQRLYDIFMIILAVSFIAGCSESRKDPCRLLSVEDVRAVDDTVAVAIWAGRDGERQDDEVCVFHTADGDPRLMLFVWYDRETELEDLVREAESVLEADLVELPDIGTRAFAAFKDKDLRLLAVKSQMGVVGIRVRKPVRRNSEEFNSLAQLAEKALSKNL